jgi:CheY-like chemotaxis protein
LRPLKVAVVDDDQIYQFIINRTLTKLQPESKILNFSNCADFFNFLKRNASTPTLLPDLILLDLNTPFMNGWEFLDAYSQLKNTLQKRIEIYLVTSSVDPNDEFMANENPDVAGFYSKPLKPEELTEIIKAVVIKNY